MTHVVGGESLGKVSVPYFTFRSDVKSRISEIQCEVHSRALMGIDEKRDRLRQMIEGTIPTKLTRRQDGTVVKARK